MDANVYIMVIGKNPPGKNPPKDLESSEYEEKPNFRFSFFELWRNNNEAGNSVNAVERKPVPTRILNPNASEASYKPKQLLIPPTLPPRGALML